MLLGRSFAFKSSSNFTYPVSTAVQATYDLDGQKDTMDPLPAQLGSTWEIQQEIKSGTPELKEGLCVV